MAKKIVKINAVQGNDFKMTATAGNHQVIIDQPAAAGGGDAGPNPLEYALISIAACIGAIGRIIANQRKLPLRGMNVSVTGELDTDNLLGINKEQRAGYQKINVDVSFDADMTIEEKIAFLSEIDSRCPVSDNMANDSSLSFNVIED